MRKKAVPRADFAPAAPAPAPAPAQVLLFCTMTRLLDVLEGYLDWRGFRALRMDGGTSSTERGALVQEFNAPGGQGLRGGWVLRVPGSASGRERLRRCVQQEGRPLGQLQGFLRTLALPSPSSCCPPARVCAIVVTARLQAPMSSSSCYPSGRAAWG